MCGCEDYDAPSVYSARVSRSRKDRKCSECSRSIARGQIYVAIKGCWDGEWSHFDECLRCDAMRQAWHDTEGCWPSHGALLDDVLECLRGEARPVAEDDDEQHEYPLDASPVNLAFGVNYRRHLGKYGPQRPRSAPQATT